MADTLPHEMRGERIEVIGGRRKRVEIEPADPDHWHSSMVVRAAIPTHWRRLPAPPGETALKKIKP